MHSLKQAGQETSKFSIPSGKSLLALLNFWGIFSVFYVFRVVFIHAYNKRHFSIKKSELFEERNIFIWAVLKVKTFTYVQSWTLLNIYSQLPMRNIYLRYKTHATTWTIHSYRHRIYFLRTQSMMWRYFFVAYYSFVSMLTRLQKLANGVGGKWRTFPKKGSH